MRAFASRRYPLALSLLGAPDMPVVFAVEGGTATIPTAC